MQGFNQEIGTKINTSVNENQAQTLTMIWYFLQWCILYTFWWIRVTQKWFQLKITLRQHISTQTIDVCNCTKAKTNCNQKMLLKSKIETIYIKLKLSEHRLDKFR